MGGPPLKPRRQLLPPLSRPLPKTRPRRRLALPAGAPAAVAAAPAKLPQSHLRQAERRLKKRCPSRRPRRRTARQPSLLRARLTAVAAQAKGDGEPPQHRPRSLSPRPKARSQLPHPRRPGPSLRREERLHVRPRVSPGPPPGALLLPSRLHPAPRSRLQALPAERYPSRSLTTRSTSSPASSTSTVSNGNTNLVRSPSATSEVM
jgi:hypothetical protein